MTGMQDFSVVDARVVVMGAALSGVAAAELLIRRGAQVTLADRKPSLAEAARLAALGVALELGTNEPPSLGAADLLVVSPGVAVELPAIEAARRRGVPIVGELELASRWLKGRIIAITGTKGKSTTTTLVGRMLAAAGRRVLVGGNIGVPLSTQVESSTADTLHVIEASSFQLETTETFHPWIAALLNFSADHLDRHPDEASYGRAKARIFQNQTPDDWTVVNADSPAALALAAAARGRRLTYAVERSDDALVFVDRDFIWQRTSEGRAPLVPLAAIRLAGRHMLSNVTAATAISHAAGTPGNAMARALEDFTGLEHVMEPVATIGGVRFINDSKATNVEAARRSIESYQRVVAIIGGRYKGGRFEDLREPLAAHGLAVVAAASMAEAVQTAWSLARPDGVVLLAPACSSFDMFLDYADRGRVFKEQILRNKELRTKN